MSNLIKSYNGWRFRRQQRSLEDWAQIRVKGRRHFVLLEAFTFAVVMTGVRDVVDHFTDGGYAFGLGFHIVQYALTGIFIGYVTWAEREKQYKKAQLKSSPQTSFQPH